MSGFCFGLDLYLEIDFLADVEEGLFLSGAITMVVHIGSPDDPIFLECPC
jgi:hypothetical protein